MESSIYLTDDKFHFRLLKPLEIDRVMAQWKIKEGDKIKEMHTVVGLPQLVETHLDLYIFDCPCGSHSCGVYKLKGEPGAPDNPTVFVTFDLPDGTLLREVTDV